MKRAALIAVLFLLAFAFPAASPATHVEFPSELAQYLEPLADGSTPSPMGHANDDHTPNTFLVANLKPTWDNGRYGSGSDLAFWQDIAVLGNYDGLRLVSIEDPSNPVEISEMACAGPQNDVSIWKDLVFMSVDSPRAGEACGAGAKGGDIEGIRIISIADRAKPVQLKFVKTDCGSHTHTLVPDEANNRVLIYVSSYPLGVPTETCSVEGHRKISVVEVPLSNPGAAQVISTPDVSPAIGCHDITVFLPGKLAGAACITESQLWDISDLANPRVISHIANPAINIHHSTTFSWDGNTLAIGDELGGAAVAPGCVDGDEHVPLGAIWFYDVSNPALPVPRGSFSIPQETTSTSCTAHNFNTVPLKNGKDVLVSGWYRGGTTIVDFTDPANPQQLGYYIASSPASQSWSSYWYRGYIYVNNFTTERGFDVVAIGHPTLHHKDTIKLKRLNPQTMEPLP